MASARKLEQDLNTLIESLHSLVRSFHISEERDESTKQASATERLILTTLRFASAALRKNAYWQDKKGSGELPEVLVEKLVIAGQSILTLIADLKRDALLSDFQAMNKHIESRNLALEHSRQETEEQIQKLMTRRAIKVYCLTMLA